jgi:hypothetical protein
MRLLLQPHALPADAAGVWVLIPLAGFVLGLAVPRWWMLLAALPFGAWILAQNELEGHIAEWVALVLTLLLGCAIACGVALRRLHGRGRARANPSNG